MPVQYIPYVPNTVEGQAVLDNITRTRRVLRYRDNGAVYDHIRRGLPLYEVTETETVGLPSENLLLRGECLSACAYLKDQGLTLDLVYIDPPFASGADYAKSVYLRRNPRQAEAAAQAEAELELDELRAFEEKMYGDIWNKEDYLNWMFENLTAIKSVMSETASIYVHLDWHIGHYVKVLLDEMFGEDNFGSEIVWKRTASRADAGGYGAIHDTILFYNNSAEYTFNAGFQEYGDAYMKSHYSLVDEAGRRYMSDNLSGAGPGPARKFGDQVIPPPAGRHWAYDQAGIDYLMGEERIVFTESGMPRVKKYADEGKGVRINDVWTDIPPVNSQASDRLDYATQKPEALLRRIIEASSNESMLVADFFGGSGVTAKVAHDLGRRFVHVDVGVNSLQTTRDRLKTAGAAFRVLDIQDGVSLFRNPVQTMDKLKTLIVGLKSEAGLDKFWEGAIQDPKLGTIPVYLPNLLDHQTKVLDTAMMRSILHDALPELPENVTQVRVYYVDIYDRPGVEKFIKEENATEVKVELRDLKEILDEVVLNDEVEYEVRAMGGGFEVEISHFASDRLQQKIDEYNQKKGLTGKAKTALSLLETGADDDDEDAAPKKAPFKPIQVSEDGLELIEWVSLDCTNAEGAWQSDAEVKIDKKYLVLRDGQKTKTFWDAKITSARKPLRLKVRNIAGDESILSVS